jgi:hypothetical protein
MRTPGNFRQVTKESPASVAIPRSIPCSLVPRLDFTMPWNLSFNKAAWRSIYVETVQINVHVGRSFLFACSKCIPITVYSFLNELLRQRIDDQELNFAWHLKVVTEFPTHWSTSNVFLTLPIRQHAIYAQLWIDVPLTFAPKTGLTNILYFCEQWSQSGFGGLEVACWPLVPEFAGSNPAEAVGFLGRKNPQHAFLRRGSKAVCPMSCFTACKRT